jgi:phosphatidylserine decarboxylase
MAYVLENPYTLCQNVPMKLDPILRYFHPAGWPFMGLFALGTVILSLFSGNLAMLGLILTVWCFYFFRDPRRVTPTRDGLIVSPADGKIVAIKEITPDKDLGLGDAPRTRISIFLNVFDVHVNRIPADSIVKETTYRPGKFVNASLDKASVDNERMALVLELQGDHAYHGKTMGVVQIAGLIARRIICDAKEGKSYRAGERFGIIRFGSRADVYLPVEMKPLVMVGQYMLGGETVLADTASQEGARQGDIRE